MTMTDPIADMLTRLRNANSAYHDAVTMPSSKIKTHIAEILQQEGYIAGWNVEDNVEAPGQTLTLTLKYGPNRERSIAGVRRVSKPGLRVYAKATNLPNALPPLPSCYSLARVVTILTKTIVEGELDLVETDYGRSRGEIPRALRASPAISASAAALAQSVLAP